MIFSANLIFLKTKLFKSHLDEGMQRYTIIFLRSKLLNKRFFLKIYGLVVVLLNGTNVLGAIGNQKLYQCDVAIYDN